jgi:hypothetical protein
MSTIMMRVHRLCLLSCFVPVAGCGWQPDEASLITPARPPAAAIAPMREATPLEDMLATLDEEIRAALEGELQGEAESSLIRAEAITDRLLEARLPFNWLSADQYNLDARLRQIQTQADRAVAALYSGQPRDFVISETELLHRQVTALRETIEQGGGPPRRPVHELIESMRAGDAGPRPAASAPPGQQPATRPPPLTAPPDTTT